MRIPIKINILTPKQSQKIIKQMIKVKNKQLLQKNKMRKKKNGLIINYKTYMENKIICLILTYNNKNYLKKFSK